VSALDDVLERLETLDEAGDEDGLRAALRDALARFPGTPELREWEASVAAAGERYADALAILDELVVSHPDRSWARRERAAVLLDLGRFTDALAALRSLPPDDDPVEQAGLHHDVGLCLDRLGQPVEADAEFRCAARLAPDDFTMPLRLPDDRFEALVGEALDDVPEEFARHLAQVVVRVRGYPAPEDGDPFLLGLYVGVARPDRTVASEEHLDHIVIFKRSHEVRWADEDELREEVRRTVIHEIAHHFGVAHEDMGDYR
jgi:predicted Zn-dependent protease with MMP-like domain